MYKANKRVVALTEDFEVRTVTCHDGYNDTTLR